MVTRSKAHYNGELVKNPTCTHGVWSGDTTLIRVFKSEPEARAFITKCHPNSEAHYAEVRWVYDDKFTAGMRPYKVQPAINV